jgi:hypothetical protein
VKSAGMFLEFGPVRQEEPQDSIFQHIAATPLEDLDRVVGYLRAGHELVTAMDIQDDVIDSSQGQVLSGSSVLTDGDWLWRKDFAYYVGRHNVAVPDELLRLIRGRNYVVPQVDEAALDACADEAVRLMW